MFSSAIRGLPRYAICSPREAARYEYLTKEEGLWSLLPCEVEWSERQSLLQHHGYALRSRYRKGWSPSWLGTQRVPDFCEDSINLLVYHVIDATCSKDNMLVSIKVVRCYTNEIDIALSLCSKDLLSDPCNHCVPILNVLPDPLDAERALLVMPYLHPFNDPPFEAVAEVIDFIHQTLEGLKFMHDHGVAHRDCAAMNVMMDGRPLYPEGHHPVRRNYTIDALRDCPRRSRLDNPVKYYFIDFGLSTRFQEGESPFVVGAKGSDREPPELSNEIPYDAFRLDIFVLGHLYYQEFIMKYNNLEFLAPLILPMIQPEAKLRPTANEACVTLQEISTELDVAHSRWRLRTRTESTSARVLFDTVDLANVALYHLTSFLP